MRLRLLKICLCFVFVLSSSEAFARKSSVSYRAKRQFDSISVLLEKTDKKLEAGKIKEAQ